jgi:hypothetical protein
MQRDESVDAKTMALDGRLARQAADSEMQSDPEHWNLCRDSHQLHNSTASEHHLESSTVPSNTRLSMY